MPPHVVKLPDRKARARSRVTSLSCCVAVLMSMCHEQPSGSVSDAICPPYEEIPSEVFQSADCEGLDERECEETCGCVGFRGGTVNVEPALRGFLLCVPGGRACSWDSDSCFLYPKSGACIGSIDVCAPPGWQTVKCHGEDGGASPCPAIQRVDGQELWPGMP